MTASDSTARPRILVAIDIAKAKHDVLVELPNGKRRKMIVRNQLSDFRQLATYLKRLDGAHHRASVAVLGSTNPMVIFWSLRQLLLLFGFNVDGETDAERERALTDAPAFD